MSRHVRNTYLPSWCNLFHVFCTSLTSFNRLRIPQIIQTDQTVDIQRLLSTMYRMEVNVTTMAETCAA